MFVSNFPTASCSVRKVAAGYNNLVFYYKSKVTVIHPNTRIIIHSKMGVECGFDF